MITLAKKFIRHALRMNAFEFEKRVLNSNRLSPYFFNSGVLYTGESLNFVARAYMAKIATINGGICPDVIFGTAYKGIPIATAVVKTMGGDIGLSYDRKESKGHGEGGDIVGAPVEGKNVIVLDDAMSTGKQLREKVLDILARGGTVIGSVVAFDRQEMGEDGNRSAIHEFENDFGIPVRSIANLDDLIDELEDQVLEFWPVLPKIFSYRSQYGAQY